MHFSIFILASLFGSLAYTSTLSRDIRITTATTTSTTKTSTTTCLSTPSSTTTPSPHAPLTPHILTTFPPGTWLENLIIRQHDSNALVTLLSTPTLLLISTTSSFPPQQIAHFPTTLGLLGIVELYHDVIYIVGGNWSAKTGISTAGTYGIWEVDMRGYIAPTNREHETSKQAWNSTTRDENAAGVQTRLVASLPNSGFLNGLTILNPTRGILLAADSLLGVVWSIDVLTGSVSVAMNSTSMAPTPGTALQLGINGLLVKDGYLYFDNTNRASVYRVGVDRRTGEMRGDVEVLVRSDGETVFPDDFTVDWVGNVWMTADVWGEMDFLPGAAAAASSDRSNSEGTAHGDSDGDLEIVAGSKTDRSLTGWTAAKFGTAMEDVKKGSLYLTTNGGPVNYHFGNWTSGGSLARLDTAELGIY